MNPVTSKKQKPHHLSHFRSIENKAVLKSHQTHQITSFIWRSTQREEKTKKKYTQVEIYKRGSFMNIKIAGMHEIFVGWKYFLLNILFHTFIAVNNSNKTDTVITTLETVISNLCSTITVIFCTYKKNCDLIRSPNFLLIYNNNYILNTK